MTDTTQVSRGQDDQPLSAPSIMNSQKRSSQVVVVETSATTGTAAARNDMQQRKERLVQSQRPIQNIVNRAFSFPTTRSQSLDGFTSKSSTDGSLFADDDEHSQAESIKLTTPAKVLSWAF